MHRWYIYVIFIALIFAPALVEHFVYAQGETDLLPIAKLLVHFGLPVLFTMLFLERSVRAVAVDPVRPWPGHPTRRELFVAGGVGLLAVIVIVGAYFALGRLVDVAGIAGDLTEQGISREIYMYVAIWLAFINPFMEEYFWRGFVFHRAYQFASGTFAKHVALWGTGFLFALHHTIIIQPWFSWWQFGLVTIFLAGAGVVLNLLYLRSGSILPPLIVHTCADLALAFLGFVVFGYVAV